MIKRRERRLKAEMNVVPYIDVMLVLLVIFMIAAPLMQRSVEIDLPQAGEEVTEERKEKDDLTLPLILTVDKEGNSYLNISPSPASPATDEEINTYAQKYLEEHPHIDVYVSGDKNANYAAIMHGIEQLRASGAKQVNLSTQIPTDDK